MTQSKRIRYTKANGEITERTIIQTSKPTDLIKAIDVTDLDSDQIKKLETLYDEYQDYVDLMRRNIYSFEDWVDHVTNENAPVKWRTFKANNIENC